MMKNKLNYFLLLILSFNGLTQSEEKIDKNFKNDMEVVFGEKSKARLESEKEFAEWGHKLNEFLLANGDDYTQAMVLAKMTSNVQTARLTANIHQKTKQIDALNDLSYQPIADVLNQLIAAKEISTQAFDTLSYICFSEEMQDHCHANVLIEKRMQQDTDNLQAYLHPFNLAVKANNKKLAYQLLHLMTVSQYSRSQLGITDQMKTLIDTFINANPVPQSAIDNMIADYQKLSGISPDKKTQLNQLMPTYMPHHIKFSFNYLHDMPPYRTVLEFCQSNVKAAESCRKIAQTMIRKSNSMLDKGVGHSLLIATYEAEKNQAGIDTAKQINDEFRQSYECIRKLSTQKYFIDSYFDPEYQDIYDKSLDEFETLIQLAELNYKNSKAKGEQSTINPKTCFQNN